MNWSVIEKLIKNRKAIIGVVGLGYVGLPTAMLLTQQGFHIGGYDRDEKKINAIKKGELPFGENEPGLKKLFSTIRGGEEYFFQTAKDDFVLSEKDIYIIVVDTPVDPRTKKPTYITLTSALETVGRYIRLGSVVIVESTIAPMTMEKLVIPLLEKVSKRKAGREFIVLHCPERITPGKTLHNLTNLDRVIGAKTKEEGELGKILYQSFCKGHIDITSYRTAEVVKTAENAQRDVDIAFANELAQICDAYGVDFYRVKELIEKVPDRKILNPGSGVGGHCLPKDSWLLLANLPSDIESSIIKNARLINDSMPSYILELLEGAFRSLKQSVQGKKVAVLGYAYREETDDSRMSPTETLHQLLDHRGVRVTIHEPYVYGFERSLRQVLKGVDAVVVMVGHAVYKSPKILKTMKLYMKGNIIVDGRHVFSKKSVEKLGFIFRGVGQHE